MSRNTEVENETLAFSYLCLHLVLWCSTIHLTVVNPHSRALSIYLVQSSGAIIRNTDENRSHPIPKNPLLTCGSGRILMNLTALSVK